MRIVKSPWADEFRRIVASAKLTLRVATPYFGDKTIKTILQNSNRNVGKSFLLALDERSVRCGSQSTRAIRLLRKSPNCSVMVATYLHAKVVIADQHSAIITSSNMTDNGLNKNVELGVYLDEPAVLKILTIEFDRWFANGSEIKHSWLKSLEALDKASASESAGRRYGNRIPPKDRAGSRAAVSKGGRVGWILVHSHKQYPDGTSPIDDLGSDYIGPWHWKTSKPMRASTGHQLLFAWNGEVFGESPADVTREIKKDMKARGYNFAFNLKDYRKGKKAVSLGQISKLRNYHSLIRLTSAMLQKYRRLANGSGVSHE